MLIHPFNSLISVSFLRKLWVSIVACTLVPGTFAASFYVHFDSGSDSNAGTSSTAPWKHCPGDANATGVPASKSLAAGDTVYFNNAVTYFGEIVLKWSGTSGNPIKYDGKTWGSGSRATIDGKNRADARGFDDKDTARNYLEFVGFKITNMGGYAEDDPIWNTTTAISSPPGGAGIDLQGGGTDVSITDCQFAEIGQWQNKVPMSGTTSVTGTGIPLQDNRRVNITNCDFTRMKTGVSIKAASLIDNIRIKDSTFHNYMNWLIDIAPRVAGAKISNITIDGCRLYDYKEFDEPNWEGLGEKPHQDGIFLRTTSLLSTWENIVIRNTVFSSDQTSNGGTASIYISQGASADIYNCVFLNDNHSNAYINMGYNKPAGMYQAVRVWNCTFVGAGKAFRGGNGSANPDIVEFRNNIVYRTSSVSNAVALDLGLNNFGKVVIDNNIYYKDAADLKTTYLFYDGGYRTFDQWRATYGVDTNSVVINPKLKSLIGVASAWDPRPAADSPAVDAGAVITAFTEDISRSLRIGAYDIGAYEHGSGSTVSPPSADPTALTVSP